MPRSPLAFLALLLLAAPLTARATVRLQASTPEVRAGETVTFTWSGLDAGVEEVELEYAVGGARWVRLSPELEAREGGYRWRSPAGVAGKVRVRLRQGERHAESVAAEIALTLIAEPNAEPAPGMRAADAWDLDHPAHGPLPSQWSAAHPAWSQAHDVPAFAVTSPDEAPEPIRTDARDASRAHTHPTPFTHHRSFESRRLPPLRN